MRPLHRHITRHRYPDNGHTQDINYFSRNARIPNSNFRFGDARNDNRRKIWDTRFLVADNGNESGQCGGGGSTPCNDNNGNCPRWASYGFCRTYQVRNIYSWKLFKRKNHIYS